MICAVGRGLLVGKLVACEHGLGKLVACELGRQVRRQAADLPAKVAKRFGCAYKRGRSLEIGWSPIFVKILGQFLCHLSMQDNFYCLAHGEVTCSTS